MAFVGKHSCFSFTRASLRQNAPPLPGLYALSNSRGWIFVGQTDNIQDTLRKHLEERSGPLLAAAPTGFTYEVCDAATRPSRLARLIHQLAPSCNSSGSELPR